jgi:hypothetical protein
MKTDKEPIESLTILNVGKIFSSDWQIEELPSGWYRQGQRYYNPQYVISIEYKG